ncbi:MAG TPA: discoidin domain-containing protein, partial [Pyrinomonadaceae bacterium]
MAESNRILSGLNNIANSDPKLGWQTAFIGQGTNDGWYNAPLASYGLFNLSSPLAPIAGTVKVTPSNVTASAVYNASSGAANAVDGNLSTAWVSGGNAPQWIQLDLGKAYTLSSVRLNVTQSPGGATTHQVYGGPAPDQLALLGTLSGTTQNGQWLTLESAAANVRYLRVSTVSSPSWVGWTEIEVYASVDDAFYTGRPLSIPGTIETENFDNGGEGVGYHDTTPGTTGQDFDQPAPYPVPSYRQPTDVDIYKSVNYSNGHLIVGQAGDWLNYTVDVATTGRYTLSAKVAWLDTVAGTFRIEVDGVDKTGPIQVPTTNGAVTTITKQGVPLPAGRHVVRLVCATNGPNGYTGGVDSLTFTLEAASAVNLAAGMPATQSSTGWDSPASRAVDGNTDGNWYNGSVSHTDNNDQAWWQVDLGKVYQLERVNLWLMTICCSSHGNFYVKLSADGNNWTSYYVAGPVDQISLPVNDAARYVKVQLVGTGYLALAEVQAMGFGSPTLANIASGKPVTQSSTLAYNPPGDAFRAVDGKTDGNYANGSVTHTNSENQPWWQVDLGASQPLSSIKLWNRTDCCSERLSNFYVLVSDAPFTSSDLQTTLKQPGVWSYYTAGNAGAVATLPVNRTGRYVRVQLNGTGVLSLAEAEVWALPLLAIPGLIQGERFNIGGEGVGYHDTTPGTTGQDFDQPAPYPV